MEGIQKATEEIISFYYIRKSSKGRSTERRLSGGENAFMPKKSAPVRTGAQRSRPRTQKSFELVRPVSQIEEATLDEQADIEEAPLTASGLSTPDADDVSTERAAEETEAAVPAKAKAGNVLVEEPLAERAVPVKVEKTTLRRATPTKVGKLAAVQEEKVASELVEEKLEGKEPAVAPKVSASARLAARRQSSQKASQRSANTLITAEHYAYVRKDLIFIAVLAIIMFAILITLYLIPGLTL